MTVIRRYYDAAIRRLGRLASVADRIPATEKLIYSAIVFAVEKGLTASEVETTLERFGVELTEHHRNVIQSCVLPQKSFTK